jgi:hypothetical protein
MYAKRSVDVAVLWLKQLPVLLVLHLELLHVGLGEAAHAALNVEHGEEAGAEGRDEIDGGHVVHVVQGDVERDALVAAGLDG